MVFLPYKNGEYLVAIIREVKFTVRPVGIIIQLCSHISEEILPRPPDRAARAPHAVHPAAPGASAEPWSQGTLYHNHITRSIPGRDMLEGSETVTWLWCNNNKWPKKRLGRTFNLSYVYGSASLICDDGRRDGG